MVFMSVLLTYNDVILYKVYVQMYLPDDNYNIILILLITSIYIYIYK